MHNKNILVKRLTLIIIFFLITACSKSDRGELVGVKTNKLWESIAKEDLESEQKEWINAREELLKGNREPLLELVDRSRGDVELMKEVSVADALEQVDVEIDSFENYYTEAFKSLTEESYRVD